LEGGRGVEIKALIKELESKVRKTKSKKAGDSKVRILV